VKLASITLDPQYDTPPVLAEYGRRYGADPAVWRFLTGTPEQVRAIASWFGLVYWPEEGSIAHTSVTAVIGREGKLAAAVSGSSATVRQLADLVERQLEP
jgi:protein SCO1/2